MQQSFTRGNIKAILPAVKLVIHRFLYSISTPFHAKSQTPPSLLSSPFSVFPPVPCLWSQDHLGSLICPVSCQLKQNTGNGDKFRYFRSPSATNIHKIYRSWVSLRSLMLSNEHILANSFRNWKSRLSVWSHERSVPCSCLRNQTSN